MDYQSLIDRNADACERAEGRRCRCHCAGALHGEAHSAEWRAEQVSRLEAAERAHQLAKRGQLDMFCDIPDAEEAK